MSATHRVLCRVVFLLQLAPVTVLAAEVGALAPQFSLPLLSDPGQQVRHPSNGAIRYVDFWSAWCVPCRKKMQRLEEVQHEFENLEIIGINVDALVSDAYGFLARHPVSYPVAFDPDGETADRYGVETLPAGFLIDQQGVVRAVMTGGADNEINKLTLLIEALQRPGEPMESAR